MALKLEISLCHWLHVTSAIIRSFMQEQKFYHQRPSFRMQMDYLKLETKLISLSHLLI